MDKPDEFSSERRRLLHLRQGREGATSNRHPWIFSGAIAREEGPRDAAFADLAGPDGSLIAGGFYSQHSQIRLRVLTWEDELTPELLQDRIRASSARRASIFDGKTNAARLIHSEGDDLSGIICDRYGDALVVEITSAGAERIKPLIVETLKEIVTPRTIIFSNKLHARSIEQLSREDEVLGDEVNEVEIVENDLRFIVQLRGGQKTGFFLDQRDNRAVARSISSSASVLNLFAYSGAFGVYAVAGGARSITEVDISAPALELARRNHALNGSTGAEFVAADVFEYVRAENSSDRRYSLLVCDPPAFAKSRGEVDRAARGYKDINLYAMKLVEPGGTMMTFSCSGHVSLDLFQKIIFAAALDAGRRVSIVKRLGAGADHPVSIYCPEGEYLKGFLLRFDD